MLKELGVKPRKNLPQELVESALTEQPLVLPSLVASAEVEVDFGEESSADAEAEEDFGEEPSTDEIQLTPEEDIPF
jgi:hypothetical protein